MQKVVGSSPIIRSLRRPRKRGFFVGRDPDFLRFLAGCQHEMSTRRGKQLAEVVIHRRARVFGMAGLVEHVGIRSVVDGLE